MTWGVQAGYGTGGSARVGSRKAELAFESKLPPNPSSGDHAAAMAMAANTATAPVTSTGSANRKQRMLFLAKSWKQYNKVLPMS